MIIVKREPLNVKRIPSTINFNTDSSIRSE